MLVSLLRWIFITTRSSSASDLTIAVLFGLFLISAIAVALYLGWRLIARWNAGTVRWVTGAALVVAIVELDGAVSNPAMAQHPSLIISLLLPLLLIAGALVFRWLSRIVIRSAELEDPLDIYGQPVGHAMRVHSFAWALALSIISMGPAFIDPHDLPHVNPMLSFLGILPLLLAVAAYKSVLWIFRPKTRPAEPPGGFEVLTGKSQES
jgi:hypothetical protein